MWHGNHEADRWAKKAANSHRAPAEHAQQVISLIKAAQGTMKDIVELLGAWPRKHEAVMQGTWADAPKRGKRPRADRLNNPHLQVWLADSKMWACRRCGKMAKQKLPNRGCPGSSSEVPVLLRGVHASHSMAQVVGEGGMQLVFCTKCAQYRQSRLVNLKDRCLGQPRPTWDPERSRKGHSTASVRLGKLMRGVHPKEGHWLGEVSMAMHWMPAKEPNVQECNVTQVLPGEGCVTCGWQAVADSQPEGGDVVSLPWAGTHSRSPHLVDIGPEEAPWDFGELVDWFGLSGAVGPVV